MTHAALDGLKLYALDREGLAVISAHTQDTCVKRADMTYQPKQKRFALAGMRYDWAGAEVGIEERVGSVLRFDRVLRVSHVGFKEHEQPDEILSMLGITFEKTEPPSGIVFLAFADGAIVRLEVECLEVELNDVGPRAEACACAGHRLTRAESV
jgi:hypothetical protein